MLRDATECLLDDDRNLAFKKAIQQIVKKGDVVLTCGAGTGILAMFAAQAGASVVYAIESDYDVYKQAIRNTHNYENIEVIYGNVCDFDTPVNAVITDTFLTNEQTRIIESLTRNKVIDTTTKLIPKCISYFFNVVEYNFDFYGITMPMKIQARNAGVDSRCKRWISNNIDLSGINFAEKKYEMLLPITAKDGGYANAIRFITRTHMTDNIIAHSTTDIVPSSRAKQVVKGEQFHAYVEFCDGFDSLYASLSF